MKRGLWYSAGAALAGVLVGLIGLSLSGQGSGVWAGVLIGTVVQVASFWILSVWAMPERPVLAHAMGMLVRLLAVGVVALVWLPRAEGRPGPTLFALVGVFFLTMLIEPVALKIGSAGGPAVPGPRGGVN